MGFLDNTFPVLLGKSYPELDEYTPKDLVSFPDLLLLFLLRHCHSPMPTNPSIKKHLFTSLHLCVHHLLLPHSICRQNKRRDVSWGQRSSLRMKNVFWGLTFWLMKTLLTLSCSQIIPEKCVFCCRLPFLLVARAKLCSHTPTKSMQWTQSFSPRCHTGNVFYPSYWRII